MEPQDTEAVKNKLRSLVRNVYEAVVILASDKEDGEHFAETLGVENWIVITPKSMASAQGMRMKLFLATPLFASWVAWDYPDARRLLEIMHRNLSMTGGPIG